METRSRLRELFLQPRDDDAPNRPTRGDLAGLSRTERRAAKIHYQTQAGIFRTWVYAVILVGLVGGFALYVSLVA
ncbi:MAG: hypothetical protein DLM59_06395 [Pseudonocardiales bacterium]|nr:MAG: hypothetical protein DLM59_06395 [Pseudonocardiales bacterium]